ncbi:hypothetical protein MOQ_007176 [Trypanosoma cruzi marinkellei]|uniref:Protein kinase n=1 Tax=Trypanosoma cruzi marinkellei TaxID=85056 RepID=K2NJJ2_TRYCR|nr:hypothetical protein MOQ_007176 [Trypanosoma cruzi marinkellei]
MTHHAQVTAPHHVVVLQPKTLPTGQYSTHRRAATRRFAPWRAANAAGERENELDAELSCETSCGLSRLHQESVERSPRQPSSATFFCPIRKQPALQRRDFMAGGVVSTSASAVCCPRRTIHELGVSVSEENVMTAGDFTSLLDEVVVPAKYTVRLHDVEGRMLVVHGDASVETSPIAPYLDCSSVNDGKYFYMKPLLERPALFSSSHLWNTGTSDGAGVAVPRWRQYTVAVALYIALADAGYCDRALPCLSIKWINWRRLLRHQLHLRLDLMKNDVTRELLQPCNKHPHHACDIKEEEEEEKGKVPVALHLPLPTKGILRCPCRVKGELPSLSTQPFTDAEVFQLFYLQLIFRAVYDIRFPGMMAEAEGNPLRSDLVGADNSGVQPLAFEHPMLPNHWLLFPPRSRVLYLMSLEEAIIPHYASPQTILDTTRQRLFGATPLLPCQGQLGREVVMKWAVHRVIHSPQEAFIALDELFKFFEDPYGIKRRFIWQASVAPRIYRCGMASLTWLHEKNVELSKFFYLPKNFDAAVPRGILPLAVEKTPMDTGIKEDYIVQRWRQYLQEGSIALFDGNTDAIEIIRFLGSGGSSLVYEGRLGPQFLPVAVKCLIIPNGMDHETYVKDSLTNVAFFVLFNQLESCGILSGTHIYEFVVSDTPPKGMPEEDVCTCSRGAHVNSGTKLCYVVTQLMDGVIGRFVTEEEDAFDPCYDTIVNTPLCDGEVFQFLYTQLVARALFDYIFLDFMLYGQLRGDNVGYAFVFRGEGGTFGCPSYDGIIMMFQTPKDASPRYLRFPAGISDSEDQRLLRFIRFIDLGQGKQPMTERLSQRGLIGETVVESCITDDGLGRYWPLDRIYSKYIDTIGTLARTAVEWGANLCVDSPQAAEAALEELFELYTPMYGVATPTSEELARHAVFEWTPSTVRNLRCQSVYRGN